jgi:hypothetical protein
MTSHLGQQDIYTTYKETKRVCLCVEVLKPRSWEVSGPRRTGPVLRPRRTDGQGFFLSALNCRRCCSGNFRIWFSRHGFQDLGSQLWGLGNFRIWFSGHGFWDLRSQLWGLNFHIRSFQDRNLKTFRTWFSRCGILILGPEFHTGASQWPSTTGTH